MLKVFPIHVETGHVELHRVVGPTGFQAHLVVLEEVRFPFLTPERASSIRSSVGSVDASNPVALGVKCIHHLVVIDLVIDG